MAGPFVAHIAEKMQRSPQVEGEPAPDGAPGLSDTAMEQGLLFARACIADQAHTLQHPLSDAVRL